MSETEDTSCTRRLLCGGELKTKNQKRGKVPHCAPRVAGHGQELPRDVHNKREGRRRRRRRRRNRRREEAEEKERWPLEKRP
mmetsp:Transcript_17203/g.46004  ORF Transcript_17203/g.46004 Transcript_17203/m.46004 type:complete len:82 (+) Transcript_17203:88-333(+)